MGIKILFIILYFIAELGNGIIIINREMFDCTVDFCKKAYKIKEAFARDENKNQFFDWSLSDG